MKKSTLRLLVTLMCPRACEGCCNKQWNIDVLPTVFNFKDYKEIIITGGEPMMFYPQVKDLVGIIRTENKEVRIFVYTATYSVFKLLELAQLVDGVTISLHDKIDAIRFSDFFAYWSYNPGHRNKSMRLNAFKGTISQSDKFRFIREGWQVKSDIVWLEDCPLPENEEFRRMAALWL